MCKGFKGIKMRLKQVVSTAILSGIIVFTALFTSSGSAIAIDLKAIKDRGVLRHLGVTYANFVRKTPEGVDGLDVEVMKLFAAHLGVDYKLVHTTWETLFTDLTGRKKDPKTQTFNKTQTEIIKGDIIANGLTILPWRQELVVFSESTFPTGIWLIASAKSTLKPIKPSGDIVLDINNVKSLMAGRTVLTMEATCLAADIYNLNQTKAQIKYYTQTKIINDIAPAMLNGMAESTLLDIPDAMVALQKWPGDIKIIGPVTETQTMGVAVNKSSPQLLNKFNQFLNQIQRDGTYRKLVEKYYPSVFLYFENFLKTDDM